MTAALPVGINYSGGTSSEWLIDAVIEGEIERPEYVAVFTSDTGDEHEWTYEAMSKTEERCRSAGIAFVRCSDPHTTLSASILSVGGSVIRADNPPLWTESQGGGRGQLIQKCTKRFKTAPIRRAQSLWLESLKKPKRIEAWIGFGADESHRATKAVARNDVQWQSLAFPAIRLGKSRSAQRSDLEKWTGSAPPFSMCVHCPFKSPARWHQTTGADLAKAIEVDEFVRHGLEPAGVDDPCFLSDRLIPVEQLIRNGDPQPSLPGLEAPGCDAGACFL